MAGPPPSWYSIAAIIAGCVGSASASCRSTCRERLRELQEHLSEYEAVRANVIALSTDSLSLVRHAADELGLTFPLVAVDSAALRPWEVFDNGTALPLPASYLLDGNGVVVFRHVGRNAADRASDLELLAALHQLRRGGR